MPGGGEVAGRMTAPLPDVKESVIEQIEEPVIELRDEAPTE